MKQLLKAAFICLFVLTTGCSVTRQQFTAYDTFGERKHQLDLYHITFLMDSRAATLKNETQTEEYINTLNSEGLFLGVNTNALKAVVEGAVAGALKP